MARVAIAYVEVRPDLGKGPTGFAEQLKAALAKVNVTESVKVTPDTKGFAGKLATAVRASKKGAGDEAEALGQLIGEEASKHMMEGWDVDSHRLTQPLGDVGDSMNAIMDLLGDNATEAFARSIQRRLTSRVVKAMSTQFDQVEEEEKIRSKAAAAVFADNYAATLHGRLEEIGHAEGADLKIRMMREFGPVGVAMAEQMIRNFNSRLAAQKAQLVADAKKLAQDIEKAHGAALAEEAKRTEQAAKNAAASSAKVMENLVKKQGAKTVRAFRQQGKDAGKNFADSFADQMRLGLNLRLGQLLPIIISIAFAAAPLAGLLSSLAAAASALAVALGEAAVAAGGALASGLLSLAQAAGVAKLATIGFSDALKAQDTVQRKVSAGVKLTQAELDKYNAAMAMLSPSAREVVTALGNANGMVATMRKNLQQRLFAGVGKEIETLARTYLPLVNAEFQRTADVLNKAGLGFGKFLTQAQTVGRVRDIMAGNTAIAERFTHALIPLADAALRLLKAIQPLGIQLAGYATAWAKAVDNSVKAADSSGRMTSVVQNLGRALDQAVRLIVNVYRGAAATFRALLGPGRTLLDMLVNLTGRWSDWARSVGGQNAIRDWGEKAIPVIHEMGLLIGDLFRAFNRLAKVGDAGGFVESLRGIVGPLEEFLAQLSASGAAEKFAKAMGELLSTLVKINAGGALANITSTAADMLSFINALVTHIPGLSTLLWGLARVLTFIAAIKFVSALTGLSKLPQYAVYVRDFTSALLGMNVAQKVTEGLAFKLGDRVRTAGVQVAIFGDQMRTATGRANVFRASTEKLAGLVAAHPFGAAVTAVGLLALGFWGIVKAANSAKTSVDSFKVSADALGKDVGPKVSEAMKSLKDRLASLRSFGDPFGPEWEGNVEEAKRAIGELGDATRGLASQYGDDVDSMVAKIYELGVSTDTSVNDIVVVMERIRTQNKNIKLSTEDLAQMTATKFGAMKGNLSDYANSSLWGKLTEQTERQRFNGLTWEEEQARGIRQQIYNLGKLYDAAYKTASGIIDQTSQLQYEKMIGKAFKQKPNISSSITNVAKDVGSSTGSAVGNAYSGAISGASTAVASSTKKAGKKTAAGFITSFKAELKTLKPADLIGHSAGWLKVGLNIAKYIAKGITNGTTNINRVGAYINKKFSSSVKKIRDEVAKYKAAAKPFVTELNKSMNLDSLSKLLDQIKDFKSQAFDTLTSGRAMTGTFGFIPTPKEVKAELDSHLAQLKTFTAGLAALQAKGLDPGLAREWLMAGPEGAGNIVAGLQVATKTEITGINDQYKAIGTEASKTADAQATKFYKVGQDTIQGYIDGIKSKQDAAVKAINDIIADVIRQANKKLGAKSPSKVFDAIGVDTVLGYIGGVQSKQRDTVEAIGDLYGAVTAVDPATLTPPTLPVKAGYANAAAVVPLPEPPAPVFDVHVFIGDRELTDIVRVEVNQADSGRARDLLAGRRGG